MQGITGIQGVTGSRGLVGNTGAKGVTGPDGLSGHLFKYRFNDNTTENFPGTARLKLNSAWNATTTEIYVDDQTLDGLTSFDTFNSFDPPYTLTLGVVEDKTAFKLSLIHI